MARRKHRPISLAVQRARDFEAVNLQPESAAREVNQNIAIQREGPKAETGARRMDAFDALRPNLAPGAYDAVRQFERDLLTSRGEGDRGHRLERVDCDTGRDRTDRMLEASDRVKAMLSRIGDRDQWLLVELLCPSEDMKLRASTWRTVVFIITGETDLKAQGAAVRAVAANLAAAVEQPEPNRRIRHWIAA
jgi:hypothetical protein